MKTLAIVTVFTLCAFATDAAAQSWRPPSPGERCPSKRGAADERGSGNHMTPANVLRAAQLPLANAWRNAVSTPVSTD
jgi:hypothetical protein